MIKVALLTGEAMKLSLLHMKIEIADMTQLQYVLRIYKYI